MEEDEAAMELPSMKTIEKSPRPRPRQAESARLVHRDCGELGQGHAGFKRHHGARPIGSY